MSNLKVLRFWKQPVHQVGLIYRLCIFIFMFSGAIKSHFLGKRRMEKSKEKGSHDMIKQRRERRRHRRNEVKFEIYALYSNEQIQSPIYAFYVFL